VTYLTMPYHHPAATLHPTSIGAKSTSLLNRLH